MLNTISTDADFVHPLAAKYRNCTDLWLEVKNSISHAVELKRPVDHVGICIVEWIIQLRNDEVGNNWDISSSVDFKFNAIAVNRDICFPRIYV